MHMKKITLLLILFSSFSLANEECIFNPEAFNSFKDKYLTSNSNAIFDQKKQQLLVNKNGDRIIVNGGGCIHLGVSIEAHTNNNLTEEQFIEKILALSNEFGSWLINIKELQKSLTEKKWTRHEKIYFIQVDDMTAFEAFYDRGKINVNFYIN